MAKHILITGGAGFIGSHLADALIEKGFRVRALDNLCEQVHGEGALRPDYLNPEVELIRGDIRDPRAVAVALKGVDAVFHFAAAVGVGQSMYEIERYIDVNTRGTAVLLEALAKKPVERLIVASSMSVYGEGLYRTGDGLPPVAAERGIEELKAGRWEQKGPDERVLEPVPTPETKTPSLSSVYAMTKYDQERYCLIVGRAYGIPAVALRFFNVYGVRQAFSNPYTGVIVIFASRLLNGKPPLIYEDGLQQRDFVSVHDVVRACLLALGSPDAPGRVFNIGSGRSLSVMEIARRLAVAIGRPIEPEITGKHRVGDIRHCFADISLARRVLKYEPATSLDEGLAELSGWIMDKDACDSVAEASAELSGRGLTI